MAYTPKLIETEIAKAHEMADHIALLERYFFVLKRPYQELAAREASKALHSYAGSLEELAGNDFVLRNPSV